MAPENLRSLEISFPSSQSGQFPIVDVFKTAFTIHIRLERSQSGIMDTVMIDERLVRLIKAEINVPVVKAVDFTSFPRTLVERMTHLVDDKSERPIFLVIDEVAIPLLHPKED